MNAFQTVILVIFGAFAIIGTILFSGFFDKSQNTSANNLMVWGTLPSNQIRTLLEELNNEKVTAPLKYEQHQVASFDTDLVEGLAEGRGPDLILLPQDLILRHQSKIAVIPYDALSRRTFTDTFIDEGELFTSEAGIIGLPLVVDPLVMYWNRDLFTNAELVQAPKSWEQVLALTAQLTKRDERNNITQSAVSLGGFNNIDYAKEILTTLFLQAEQRLVVRDEENKSLRVALGGGEGQAGAEAAIQFFTEFSNPTKEDVYTWNSALRGASALFAASRLAMYFAPFSDAEKIRTENPHLNFDLALMPQRENGSVRTTFGNLYAVASLKSSQNVNAAMQAAMVLAQVKFAKSFADAVGLAPARRDILSEGSSNADLAIAYRSAIIARSWLDPNPVLTTKLFKATIEGVISGVARDSDAISQLASQLGDVLPQNQ